MRLATTKGEKNVSELVTRVFDIKGPGAKARAKEAEAALLEANPHLANVANLPEGTVIVLPEAADVKPAEEARPLETSARNVLTELAQNIGNLRAVLESSVNSQAQEARDALELLKSPELLRAVERSPSLKERLPKSAEEATARLRDAEALRTFQQQLVSQFEKDLTQLLKALG